jgi:hypothetical protein
MHGSQEAAEVIPSRFYLQAGTDKYWSAEHLLDHCPF